MKRFFITAIFFLLSAFYMWGQTVSTYEYEIGSYDDYYYDGYTISGNEAIEYIITLPCRMLLTVSHCNSSGYNYTELKFGDQMIIENCGTGQNAALKQFSQVLDAGTYRFISSGSPQEEDALLDIVVFVEKTGATFNGSTSPIEAGILNNGSAVEYTRNGLDYTDSYTGADNRSGGDIYYRFSLNEPQIVTVTHQAERSVVSHLLDESFALISDEEAMEFNHTLSPGTYYLVVEDANGLDGEVRTNMSAHSTDGAGYDDSSQVHFTKLTSCNVVRMAELTVPSTIQPSLALSPSSARIEYNYANGFGQLSEQMLVGQGGNQEDIVVRHEYDGLGRKYKEWVPTAFANNNGNFATTSSIQSRHSDSSPYTLHVYEPSALKRITCLTGPGEDWQKLGKGKHTYYSTNNPGEIKMYKTNSLGSISSAGYYPAGSLSLVTSIDEDGHTIETYKDNRGRKVLERRGGADTYYVYNDYGNLAYVLQPLYNEGVNITLSAFSYKYDWRQQCISKQKPGCEPVHSLYDIAGRLICSQDGNLRTKGKWNFTLADGLGRIALTGICTNNYNYEVQPLSETYVKAVYTAATNNSLGYSVNGIATAGFTVYSATFYDNHDFIGKNGCPTTLAYVVPPSGYEARYTGSCKGLCTGKAIARLDNSGVLGYDYVAYYYDDRGRIVQTRSTNHLGGMDVEYVSYNFTGEPIKLRREHTVSGKNAQIEIYDYTYDPAGRLTKVQHKLGSGSTVTLASYTYDELGRLKTKTPHGLSTNRLTYSYNLRGWLTGISGTRLTQNLYYNSGSGTPSYNGNISSLTWKAGSETTLRGYKFAYDGLDRLTSATYGEGSSIGTNANRFTEKVTGYDRNGNILGLQRYGQTGAGSYGLVDNLTCTLEGNRLTRVDDAASAAAYNDGFEFKDAVKQANEYAYDANGNLTKDLNKNISNIQYNFLNLPSKVTFGDGSTITYTYTADGTKLRTVHKSGSTTTTTDYCGNVIYENGVQKLLLTEEGYITLADKKYHYYLKDHQGNNRVVVSQTGAVEETNHYYPFGGLFANADGVQPYKYNGKELDTAKGLNLYDYGARMYDPALGRFTTMDPMAEKYYSVSPYAYCGNEPVRRIDPDGKDWRVQTHYNEETGKMEYDVTVRAVLINNSSNQQLDMSTLASQIVNQVNNAYTTSNDAFVSTMNLQLRTVSSVDDIKDYEHVLQIVDQNKLTKKSGSTVMGETYKNSLDIKVGMNAVSNMLNNDDNRTFAHELGHSGGLDHTMNVENLMTQKIHIQNKEGDYLKAIQLNHSQIRTIRDNYIHNRLNRHIPNWRERIRMKL